MIANVITMFKLLFSFLVTPVNCRNIFEDVAKPHALLLFIVCVLKFLYTWRCTKNLTYIRFFNASNPSMIPILQRRKLRLRDVTQLVGSRAGFHPRTVWIILNLKEKEKDHAQKSVGSNTVFMLLAVAGSESLA